MGKTHGNERAYTLQTHSALTKHNIKHKEIVDRYKDNTHPLLQVIGSSAVYHTRQNAYDEELQLAQNILVLECAVRELDSIHGNNNIAANAVHTIAPQVYNEAKTIARHMKLCADVTETLPVDILLSKVAMRFADATIISEAQITKEIDKLRNLIALYMPQTVCCNPLDSVACIDTKSLKPQTVPSIICIDMDSECVTHKFHIKVCMPAYRAYKDSQQYIWRDFARYIYVTFATARLRGEGVSLVPLSSASIVFTALFEQNTSKQKALLTFGPGELMCRSKTLSYLTCAHSVKDLCKIYALSHYNVYSSTQRRSSRLKSLAAVNLNIHEEHLYSIYSAYPNNDTHMSLLNTIKSLNNILSGNTVYAHEQHALPQQCIILSKLQLHEQHATETYSLLSELAIGALVMKQSIEIMDAYMHFIEEIYTQQMYSMQAHGASQKQMFNNDTYIKSELCVLLPQQNESKYKAQYMPYDRSASIEAMFIVAFSDILTRMQNIHASSYKLNKHSKQLAAAIAHNMHRHIQDLCITVRTQTIYMGTHAHAVYNICHYLFNVIPPAICRHQATQLAAAQILKNTSLSQFIHNEQNQIGLRTQILASLTQRIAQIVGDNTTTRPWAFKFKNTDRKHDIIQRHKTQTNAYHTRRIAYSTNTIIRELLLLSKKNRILFSPSYHTHIIILFNTFKITCSLYKLKQFSSVFYT